MALSSVEWCMDELQSKSSQSDFERVTLSHGKHRKGKITDNALKCTSSIFFCTFGNHPFGEETVLQVKLGSVILIVPRVLLSKSVTHTFHKQSLLIEEGRMRGVLFIQWTNKNADIQSCRRAKDPHRNTMR